MCALEREFLVLMRPDFLTSLLCTVEKSPLLLRRASEDIKLDWMLPEYLLSVTVAPPRVYLLVPRGLVLCLFLFMLALG